MYRCYMRSVVPVCTYHNEHWMPIATRITARIMYTNFFLRHWASIEGGCLDDCVSFLTRCSRNLRTCSPREFLIMSSSIWQAKKYLKLKFCYDEKYKGDIKMELRNILWQKNVISACFLYFKIHALLHRNILLYQNYISIGNYTIKDVLSIIKFKRNLRMDNVDNKK